MIQQFVDRVVAGVRRLELSLARRAPSGVVLDVGDAPPEDDFNRFPRWNLCCDLRRDVNLAGRTQFALEIGTLHSKFRLFQYHLTYSTRRAFIEIRKKLRTGRCVLSIPTTAICPPRLAPEAKK